MQPAAYPTNGSGVVISNSRTGRLVDANGLLVLVPCAIVLKRSSAAGAFDTTFYLVQAIELLAGAISLTLMGLNPSDGVRMSR